MPHTINGPHHLIGVHHELLDAMLARLRTMCQQANGSLDLEALNAFFNAELADTRSAYDPFKAVYQQEFAAASMPNARGFDLTAIGRFALITTCHYRLAEAFPHQRRNGPKDWAAVVSNTKITVGLDSFAPAFPEQIERGYRRLASREGKNLSIQSLAAAPEIKIAVRALIGGFVHHMENLDAFSRMENEINHAISKNYRIAMPNALFITDKQMTTFTTRLWEDLADQNA